MINRPTGEGIRSGTIFTNFEFFKSIDDISASTTTHTSYDFTKALVSSVFENTLNGEFKITASFMSKEAEKYIEGTNQPIMVVSWENGSVVCGVTRIANFVDGISKQDTFTMYMEPLHQVYGPKFSRKINSKELSGGIQELFDYTYNKFKTSAFAPKIKTTKSKAKVVSILQNETINEWVRKQTARTIDSSSNSPMFAWQNIEGYNVFSLDDILAQDPVHLTLVGPGQKGEFISSRIDGPVLAYYCMDFVETIKEDVRKKLITDSTLYRTFNSYTGEMTNLNTIADDDILDVVDIPINGLNEVYDKSGFGQALIDSFMKTLSSSWTEVDVFMPKIVLTPGSMVRIFIKPDFYKDYIVFKTLVETAQDKGRQRLSLVSVAELPKFITENIRREFKENKKVEQ